MARALDCSGHPGTPKDTCTLLDGWVVTELWRRMGISRPDPSAGSVLRVPLGRDGTDALSERIRGY